MSLLKAKFMWSQDLRDRTRRALMNVEVVYVMADMTMPLKKWAKSPSVFGVIHIRDASAHKYMVKSRLDETVWQYDTLDELIDDGWAIDG